MTRTSGTFRHTPVSVQYSMLCEWMLESYLGMSPETLRRIRGRAARKVRRT